jgi:hypothetical protein
MDTHRNLAITAKIVHLNTTDADFFANLPFRPQQSTLNYHVQPLAPPAQAEILTSFPSNARKAATPCIHSSTPAPNEGASVNLDSLSLDMTIAQRVHARGGRRRAPISPFAPQKSVNKPMRAYKVMKPRRSPAFGQVSSLTQDEIELNTALSKKAHQVPGKVTAKLSCVCHSPTDATMVKCDLCTIFYHPVCIGKGRHSRADFRDEERFHQAKLDDVDFYHTYRRFTCRRCDIKVFLDETAPPKNLELEMQRKARIFAAKHILESREKYAHECDSCIEFIDGTRYECKYCVDFNLCNSCYKNPKLSSRH